MYNVDKLEWFGQPEEKRIAKRIALIKNDADQEIEQEMENKIDREIKSGME